MTIFTSESEEIKENEEENPIVAHFIEVGFDEFNHLGELYSRTEELDKCLPLMHPDGMRQIISNAIHGLTELCMSYSEDIFNDFCEEHGLEKLHKFRPEVKHIPKVRETITGKYSLLETSISHYENYYSGFINLVSTEDNSDFGAVGVGGAIGAIVLGPLGACLGAAAGNWLGNEMRSGEIEEQSERLCNEFLSLVNEVSNYLEVAVNQAIDILGDYIQAMESQVEQKKIGYSS